MRVLFTSQPGEGHWRPLAPFARALEAAGHTIAFATVPHFCAIITRHGFRCFSVGIDDWKVRPPSPPMAQPEQAASVWITQFAGTRLAESMPDYLTLIPMWKPDLIVREMTEFAGCLVAERFGLPHAAVQVSAYRPHHEQLVAPALDAYRATLHLPPAPDAAMLHRYLTLCPVPPRFQDPGMPLPPTAHAVRHIAFDHEGDGNERLSSWIEALPHDHPIVYATLGTAYNQTPGLFAAILAALREASVTAIVTVGNQDPDALGPQPPHLHIARYIPQSLLFPHCDLAIIHGGFGTTMTALSHGLPLVIIPIAADMPDNARRCAALGVARVILPEERTPEAIRAAMSDVLDDARYRANAEQLRDEMRSLPGPEYAVRLLEQLVRERGPILSPHRDTMGRETAQ